MSNGQENDGASNDNVVVANTVEETERNHRVKRIRFRCWHRGIKEMDLLIGGFADKYLADMSDRELDLFEQVLTVPDQELYAMLVRDAPHWPELDEGIMARLMAHCQRTS